MTTLGFFENFIKAKSRRNVCEISWGDYAVFNNFLCEGKINSPSTAQIDTSSATPQHKQY
jgi:hypothetical protein